MSREVRIIYVSPIITTDTSIISDIQTLHVSNYKLKKIKKKAGFHRPLPLEAYRICSDLGGELHIRHIEYRRVLFVSLAYIFSGNYSYSSMSMSTARAIRYVLPLWTLIVLVRE